MGRLIAITVLLMLSACSSYEHVKPITDEFHYKVVHAPNLKTDGYSIWSIDRNTCTIYLKNPPKCEIHEYLHCRYGNWHGEDLNGDYCDTLTNIFEEE